jgi:hypothetical protein
MRPKRPAGVLRDSAWRDVSERLAAEKGAPHRPQCKGRAFPPPGEAMGSHRGMVGVVQGTGDQLATGAGGTYTADLTPSSKAQCHAWF